MKSSLTAHAQFTRIASTPCDNAMAWPKLSAMNNRNGRRARTMSLMTVRRRSVLRMHDLLSKMPTRRSPQSLEDAPPPRENASRSSPLGRSCRSPSTTRSPISNIWTGQSIISCSVGPTSEQISHTLGISHSCWIQPSATCRSRRSSSTVGVPSISSLSEP